MNGPAGSVVRASDRPSAIAAAACVTGLNALMINVQPLILGALAHGYGLGVRDLGHLGAAYIGSSTLATLSAPLWIRILNWRLVTRVCALAAAALAVSGALVHTAGAVLVIFAVLGVVHAALGAPSFASLGDATNRDRSFAASVIAQSLIAAVMAVVISSLVVPRFAVRGLFIFLALTFAASAAAARWLPSGFGADSAPDIASPAPVTVGALTPALVAAFGLGLFSAGALAFWYFDERLGVSWGVSPGVIGAALGVGSLASIPAAGVVAWLSKRASSAAFIVAGTLVILFGFALMTRPGVATYVIGNLTFAIGWAFSTPAYYAVLRRVDTTGRFFVAAPAVGGGAGALTGLVAGPIIEKVGYPGLMGFSGLMILLAALTLGCAVALARLGHGGAGFGALKQEPL